MLNKHKYYPRNFKRNRSSLLTNDFIVLAMLRVGQTANEPLAGNPARFIVRHAREGRRVGDRATARLTDACVAQVVRWKPQFPSVKFALNALADGRMRSERTRVGTWEWSAARRWLMTRFLSLLPLATVTVRARTNARRCHQGAAGCRGHRVTDRTTFNDTSI